MSYLQEGAVPKSCGDSDDDAAGGGQSVDVTEDCTAPSTAAFTVLPDTAHQTHVQTDVSSPRQIRGTVLSLTESYIEATEGAWQASACSRLELKLSEVSSI